MTIDDFVKIGALRSGMRQYTEKRDKAIRLCEEQFRTHKRPYVAISGGKDSVAMAYIVDTAARRAGGSRYGPPRRRDFDTPSRRLGYTHSRISGYAAASLLNSSG